MTSQAGLQWPVPPEIVEPKPQDKRRAWGKLSYEERYRRQRVDLLRAAARLASGKGFSGTRIADIVSEAGLSKGTFYEHFQSKDECFLELYRRTNAAMIRAGIRAAEANFDRGPFATVLAVCRALTGYVAQDPRLAQVLTGEFGAASQRGESQSRVRIDELFVVIARRLGTSVPEEDLPLAAKISVNGVTSVLPELRRPPANGRRVSSFDEELRAVARIGCRSLGLDDPDPQEPAP